MNRKEKERLQKLDAIIDAAEKIFFSKGFTNATMADVAKQAEYSKGSIYFYFKSKNDLCLAIVNRSLTRIKELFQKLLSEKFTGLELFSKLVDVYLEFQMIQPDYFSSIASFRLNHLNCNEDSEYMWINKNINREINSIIKTIIQKGISDKSIRSDIDADKLAASIWGDLTGILPGFFINDTIEMVKLSQETLKYIFELLIRGIKK